MEYMEKRVSLLKRAVTASPPTCCYDLSCPYRGENLLEL
jgi:hypothetical protein